MNTMIMQAIFGTNVFFSYLLSRRSDGAIARVMEACFSHEEIELIVPQPLLQELRRAIAEKPYLRQLITSAAGFRRCDLFVTLFVSRSMARDRRLR